MDKKGKPFTLPAILEQCYIYIYISLVSVVTQNKIQLLCNKPYVQN